MCKSLGNSKKSVEIAICGKYTLLQDAYASLIEALKHAGYQKKVNINIEFIDSVKLEKGVITPQQAFSKKDAILVPIGFGSRGVEGKIKAITYARKNKIPFLGLCMGLQLAVIEFSRNVCNIKEASSEEFGKTKEPVICYLPDQQEVTEFGATMRLGLHTSTLKKILK